MKDFTLKFDSKDDFKSFVSDIGYDVNEEVKNQIMIDEIGFTYSEIPGDYADEEDIKYVKNDGYFVNVRVIDDKFNIKTLRNCVVMSENKFREWA